MYSEKLINFADQKSESNFHHIPQPWLSKVSGCVTFFHWFECWVPVMNFASFQLRVNAWVGVRRRVEIFRVISYQQIFFRQLGDNSATNWISQNIYCCSNTIPSGKQNISILWNYNYCSTIIRGKHFKQIFFAHSVTSNAFHQLVDNRNKLNLQSLVLALRPVVILLCT